jgi:O6-methylguanine-DNA--protein-cysteine methyltransferase
VCWENDDPHRVRLGPMVEGPAHLILVETGRQLAAYFAGNLKAFIIPLDIKGTEFQKRVWAALSTIPFGETRSYGQIARQIGHPPGPCARWAPRMAATLSRSSLRATAWRGGFRRADRVCRWS